MALRVYSLMSAALAEWLDAAAVEELVPIHDVQSYT
jgi:hypothetical protein